MAIISHLKNRRFKSTEEVKHALAELGRRTGWRDDLISRLALSRSLNEAAAPPLLDASRKGGKELRCETLFRTTEDLAILPYYVALIVEHSAATPKSDDEVYELIIAHWHRGVLLLLKELDRAASVDKFVAELARRCVGTRREPSGLPGDERQITARRIVPLTIPIGHMGASHTPFAITLNDTRTHSNCHMAISGISGSGKTQLAMQIAASIANQCDRALGILFVDFAKGDVAGNTAFVEEIGAKVFTLPGDVLSVGAFHLREYSDNTIRLVAEEKREVYTNLFRTLGPRQEGRLAEAIRLSYASLADEPERAPDFKHVERALRQIYQRDGLADDSLTELFRRLNAYRVFWSREDDHAPVSPIHAQRWIVDIHQLGGLKEVVAFTLIEQLYREMRALPDSKVDDKTGLREIRCILFIDEAQYYLSRKNRFLQGLIREGRSKGFAVVLLCQSPDDFDQPDFDYTEQLEFTYMLAAKTDPKSVRRLLGTSAYDSKRLAEELGRMEPLHGIGRASKGASPKFRIVPFFEMHTAKHNGK
jgi:DNA sulfur modification protein DndE